MDNKELIEKILEHGKESVDIKEECIEKLREILAEGERLNVEDLDFVLTYGGNCYEVKEIYKEDGDIYIDFGDGDDMNIDDATADEVIYMMQEILCDIEDGKKKKEEESKSPLVPIIRNVLKELHGIDTSYLNDAELEKVLNEIEADLVERLRGGFELGKLISDILK
jgi:hypothetical protein